LQGKPIIAGKSEIPATLQLDLFKEDKRQEALDMIRGANLENLTPLQALNLLAEIKNKLS
jgi:hypothetical protein